MVVQYVSRNGIPQLHIPFNSQTSNLLTMKAGLLIPITALSALALSLQSCTVGATLVDSQQVTITHEHRVHLPAAMYSPGSNNTPMFEKKGELSLAIDMTNSGENSNDDSNPEGDPMHIKDGITHQDISKTRTFSVNAGYALSDKIGLTASISTGKNKEEYRPYIESWNLTQEIYNYEYWAGIPLDWDTWIEGTWYDTEQIQTINDYQKVSKNLSRSYQYFDSELAIGKYSNKNKIKTGLYAGLGYAQNQADGHMDRSDITDAYGHHEASFFKMFVLPSAAFRKGWIEIGGALKGSYLHYNLKSTEVADRAYKSDSDNLFFVEPSMFLRIGPRAFRINLEQKWLACLGKSPFPSNNSFTSIGIVSTLNVKDF
jgi:hypothetical protein